MVIEEALGLDLLGPAILIIVFVVLTLVVYLVATHPQLELRRREREETPPAQQLRGEEIEDRCERVDRLFDIAVVLITVFSTIVLSYASVRSDFQNSMLDAAQRSMAEVNFSFRVLTIPLVTLIFVWLVRGLVPSHGHLSLLLKMLLRQFCWGFFCMLFNLNALVFLYLLFTKNPIELFQFQNWLSFLLFGFINAFAMWNYTVCHPTFSFFRSRGRRFVWIFLGPAMAEVVSWILIMSWIKCVILLP